MHAQSEAGRYRTWRVWNLQKEPTKEPALSQRYFSDPHLPKISPVPSSKDMNVSIRITFNTHCNLLACIQA